MNPDPDYWPYDYSEQDWQACLRVLQNAARQPDAVPELQAFKTLISGIYKTARRQHRHERAEERLAHDQALLKATGKVRGSASQLAAGARLLKPVYCYSCKTAYTELDVYYHRLCPPCAEEHRARRGQLPNLCGRYALVTGGRIKIGHAAALRLLRCGAEVWVTSRFPALAAVEFGKAADYLDWRDRLHFLGLDLLDLGGLEVLIARLYDELPQLDILINNAALTLWQPPAAKRFLQTQEAELQGTGIPAAVDLNALLPVPLSGESPHSPQPALDGSHNSWLLELERVPAREMLEVTVINQVAPMMLCSQLKGLMLRSPHPLRWIVNVTAIEGQFSDSLKMTQHAHTNAAKAALNMITRTIAVAYAADGILVNAVDPGWVSVDQHAHKYDPHSPVPRQVPPLDGEDAAARILAPIHDAFAGQLHVGKLFKNYRICDW